MCTLPLVRGCADVVSILPSRSPRILVVDDEARGFGYHQCLLWRHSCEMQTTQCAEEALRLLQEQGFDLLLLDLYMPGIGGVEFLRALRRQKDAPEVLGVSGYAPLGEAAEAMRLGAQGVVAKSDGPGLLLQQVNGLLDLHRR